MKPETLREKPEICTYLLCLRAMPRFTPILSIPECNQTALLHDLFVPFVSFVVNALMHL